MLKLFQEAFPLCRIIGNAHDTRDSNTETNWRDAGASHVDTIHFNIVKSFLNYDFSTIQYKIARLQIPSWLRLS